MLDMDLKREKVEIALRAGQAVFTVLQRFGHLKRDALAVRVLLLDEGVLITDVFGDKLPHEWEHPYDEIAAGKETISLRTGLPSRIVQTVKRFLLRRGDVKYWGNAIEPGVIIVSCSGVQPWIDELISKIILNTYLALVEDHTKKVEEAEGDYYE